MRGFMHRLGNVVLGPPKGVRIYYSPNSPRTPPLSRDAWSVVRYLIGK